MLGGLYTGIPQQIMAQTHRTEKAVIHGLLLMGLPQKRYKAVSVLFQGFIGDMTGRAQVCRSRRYDFNAQLFAFGNETAGIIPSGV